MELTMKKCNICRRFSPHGQSVHESSFFLVTRDIVPPASFRYTLVQKQNVAHNENIFKEAIYNGKFIFKGN